MILKLAKTLRGTPYFKTAAADALQDWVLEQNNPAPLMEVSYCKLTIGLCRSLPTSAQTFENAMDDHEFHAVGLEPPMGPLRVKSVKPVGKPKVAPASTLLEKAKKQGTDTLSGGASRKACFVYPLASTIAIDHGLSFDEALKRAEACWKRCPEKMQRLLPKEVETRPEPDDEVIDVDEPGALR